MPDQTEHRKPPEVVFGQRVKRERQQRGWRQEDLAAELARLGLDLHPSAIAKVEREPDPGRSIYPRMIRLDEAVTFAAAFGLTVDEMLATGDGGTFTVPPMPGTEPNRPLLVLPLPTDARMFSAVMLIACDWWEKAHGVPLAFGPQCGEEGTPYGRAVVLHAAARAAAGGGAGNPAVGGRPPPTSGGGDR